MRLDFRQKIATVISVVFFIVWIAVLAVFANNEHDGSANGATFTAMVGCAAIAVFYVLLFAGKTKVSARLDEKDTQKIKSCILDSYIATIYVLIAGFFIMTVAVINTDYSFSEVRKFNWVGATVLITLIMLSADVLASYLIVRGVERRLSLQEKNDAVTGKEESESEQGK